MFRPLLIALALLAVTAAPAGAVAGGQPASRPYPFMAALEFKRDFICGATLVSPTQVLTAAHCVRDGRRTTAAGDLRVLVGTARRSDRAAGETLAVSRVEVHQGYGADTARNDVALLDLAAASSRAPVRLAQAGDRPRWSPGTKGTVIGWGGNLVTGDPVGISASDDLREVDLTIRTNAECAADPAYDPAIMLCAGEDGGGKDACQGDSGGPMLIGDGAGGLLQIGVVSFGLGCGIEGQYGYYASVGDTALRRWVTERLRGAPTAPATDPEGGGPAGPAEGCVPRSFRLATSGAPGLRIGRRPTRATRRCVTGGGVLRARTRRGRVALVVTTGPRHRAGALRVGGPAPSGRTRDGSLRRRGRVFALVRSGRIVALAVADRRLRGDTRTLARAVRGALR